MKTKLFSLLFSIALILNIFSLAGCSSTSNFTVYYGIDKMPQNLDPILSTSFSEILTAKNCFRGLFKVDSNDETVPDIVKDYDISNNKTTYTFELKECYWENDTPITADDFVFSVERASAPETESPYINLISNIKGVTERLNGKNSELGIVAVNDKTLKIELIKPDPYFLMKLTSPVFMPCNRAFFEKSGGKYGLNKDNILTNGNFKVSIWSDEKYIKLKRTENKQNNGAIAEYVVLTESKTGKSNIKRIKDNEIGMTTLYGENYTELNTDTHTIEVKYNKTYALIFNKLTLSENLIDAFSQSVNREGFAAKLDKRFKLAESIIPDDSLIIDKTAKSSLINHKHSTEYNPTSARKLYLDAINNKKNSKAPTFKIIYNSTDNEIKSTLNNIISEWQSTLGAYITLESYSTDTELKSKVKSNNFQIAVVPLDGSVNDILSFFAFNENQNNYNIINKDYDIAVKSLNNAQNIDDSIFAANLALKIISDEKSVFPIIHSPTAFVYNSEYKNVHFSKYDGTIDFSLISK